MNAFVRVAQRESFAAAARDLRLSPASVTKQVAALEARVSVRLFDRTTRHVRLTEAGRLYLERCRECLQAFRDAEAAVASLSAEPRGVLRIAAPIDFRTELGEVLTRFGRAHPAITLDVRLSNRTPDLVEPGTDVYIRFTKTLDPQVIARPLAISRLGLWASRDYLRRHGRPRTPAELAAHSLIAFDEPPVLDRWTLERGRRRTTVTMRPSVVTNSGELAVECVRDGLGLAVMPSFLRPTQAGLEPVLADWSLGFRRVYAVYPHRRFVPSKVRLFIDALTSAFTAPNRDPWS